MPRQIRSKTQPTARTMLTEFRMQIADVSLRQSVARGSIAKRVSDESPFSSGDAVCNPDAPFVIENIKTAILIQAYRSFNLTIQYKDGALVDVPCSGLFLLYGELDRVEVSATEQLRFSYVKS